MCLLIWSSGKRSGQWASCLLDVVFFGASCPPRIPVSPEWHNSYSLGAKSPDWDSNILNYNMGIHSNVAPKIEASIARLWGWLLSCSVEIREHLTGSGPNVGEVTWGSFVPAPWWSGDAWVAHVLVLVPWASFETPLLTFPCGNGVFPRAVRLSNIKGRLSGL